MASCATSSAKSFISSRRVEASTFVFLPTDRTMITSNHFMRFFLHLPLVVEKTWFFLAGIKIE
jgi:hypothetical protein